MIEVLLLTFIFLIAGVIAVPIATRLGLGSVLGYLIAGIALGPLLTVLGVDVISIQHFAEFGVVMMLFLVGLELQPKSLWEMRGRLIGLGGGQVALTTFAGMGVAILMGQPWTIGLAIGLILSLSSTAIVLQTLQEKNLMRSDGGQASFSVLLSQDIAVIPMLALLPLLAMPDVLEPASAAIEHAADYAGDHEDGGHGAQMSLVAGLAGWQTALVNFAAIAAVVGGGAFLTGPLFRFIASANLRELFTATALMLVIGIALLMSLVGLSPALGAFLGGVVLANSPYRHELESDVDPFRGLLLGLFFITVGASINFGLLADTVLIVSGLTLLLLLTKGLIVLSLAALFGIRGADKWLAALALAQAGEFGFVLLTFAVTSSVLPQHIADLLLLVVALSMLLTPGLFIFYDRVIAPRYAKSEEREADDMPKGRKVIIAGAGRMGGLIDRILRAAGIESTVIDYSSRRLAIMERFGTRHFFGDATRPDLLAAAGIAEAQLLIVAVDDAEAITSIVQYVRKAYPNVRVVARAVDRDHVYDLWAHGCRNIIRETYDSTLRIGRSALEELGIETSAAQAVVDAFNAHDRKAMIAVASAHKPGVAPHENEEYVARVRELRGDWEAQLNAEIAEILAEPTTKSTTKPVG